MAKLTEFDPLLALPEPDQVLARAGCPPSAGRDILDRVGDVLVRLSESARPCALSRTVDVIECSDRGILLQGISFRSRDLAMMLKGSNKATVFLITLGLKPETQVRRHQKEGDHALAHMLDAAASSMVEKCAELLQEILNGEMPDLEYSFRYAPGYGDLGLEHQQDILRFLQGNRLDVALLETSYMLEPAKSTTGVIGWHRRES